MTGKAMTMEAKIDLSGTQLKFLDLDQITMIDEALHSVGEFGEVRLAVQKGRLRFLITQRSHDALKWEPGDFAANGRSGR